MRVVFIVVSLFDWFVHFTFSKFGSGQLLSKWRGRVRRHHEVGDTRDRRCGQARDEEQTESSFPARWRGRCA